MKKKNLVKVFVISTLLILLALIGYYRLINKEKESKVIKEDIKPYNSNLLDNVEYVSKDNKGNEYIIKASKGEIDLTNSDVIFLENVRSMIILNDSNKITITSDYGRYNAGNYNTIFSQNVVIKYLDNTITGEYLDFSLERNTMIVSRNVIYTNTDNILAADVIEMNIETKDTEIFMYDNNEKVNIKNRN